MHVRFSSCRGLPILEDGTQDFCGWVNGIVLHPETGNVEGFTVRGGGGAGGEAFLLRDDIVRWGKCVWIRSVHAIGPLEDIVRLRSVLSDPRRILGQRIRTESGKKLGVCRDIQFSTATWGLEWIFPRKWWVFWGIPIARKDIVEVTTNAIIVRDPLLPQKERSMALQETVRLEELVEVPRPS